MGINIKVFCPFCNEEVGYRIECDAAIKIVPLKCDCQVGRKKSKFNLDEDVVYINSIGNRFVCRITGIDISDPDEYFYEMVALHGKHIHYGAIPEEHIHKIGEV